MLSRSSAESRFGVDLCRINGSVYVLNVHEKDANSEAAAELEGCSKYLPGYRAGLTRFDEAVQVRSSPISPSRHIRNFTQASYTHARIHVCAHCLAVISAGVCPRVELCLLCILSLYLVVITSIMSSSIHIST